LHIVVPILSNNDDNNYDNIDKDNNDDGNNDIDNKNNVSLRYEQPPISTLKMSYWQLRIIGTSKTNINTNTNTNTNTIGNSIENGGYLTPNLYIPKNLWTQYGVKFSGLSAKTRY